VAAIVSAIVCLSSARAGAQGNVPATTPPKPSPEAGAGYAQESILIERAESIYTYAADGTGLLERDVAARVQSDAAVKALGVVSVAYAANSQQVEFVYARVRHPDGTVVETPVTDALDMPAPVTREAPFYSDLKEKQLPIRSLRVGDRLEWRARITTTKSEVPGQFWGAESFVDDSVALAEAVELRVPAGVAVNVWSPAIKATESDVPASGAAPALHVWRWTAAQLKPMAGKEAEAEAEAKKKLVWTPEQETDAEQGKLPAIAWTTFKSWQEVGAWYAGLEADRTTPGPEVKAKVAELTAGKTTDEDKVKALYAYVATQVRYIGVAFGIGRYQPHTAAEILSNQYGDCKDKHTLLAAMLAAAGIKADAVLIGAGVRFNEAVPSPAAFNHLITHATVAGAAGQPAQEVWLDSTAEIAPYRMLVPTTRDKRALVVPNAGAAYIARTPADPPFASFQTMDATGEIDKTGTSHSRLTFVVRGDTELALREAFRQTAPAQYEELAQQIVHSIGYAGTTSNSDVMRPDDMSGPFKLSFDYVREKAGNWNNYQILPQVAPVSLVRFGDDDPLVRNLDLGSPRVETSHAAMKIPEGWTAVLPEAAHYQCAYATYDETYRFEKGTVYTERRIEILKATVPSGDLKTYKKWADDADLGNEFFVQLVRHDKDAGTSAATGPAAAGSAAAAGEGASATPSAQAQKLIEQAYEDVGKMDLYNAKDLLDKAQKLSPDHEYYWNTTGYMHYRNGEMTDALTDYKKELALHPAAYQRMCPVIIGLEVVLGQRKEAIDTLRGWTKADPVDPAPVTQLLNMLLEDGDAKTAVAEGEAAFARLPAEGKNDEARIALGQAYLKAGDKAKGQAALETVLKNAEDAETLNDAAYDLADASLDLTLAETSTRAALDKLAAESNSWTLDEDPRVLLGKTQMIVATWDTLGWIYFREGKLDLALSYIEAGWMGSPGLESGKHVGEVLTARGDKAGALNAYELAIATVPGYNALGVHTEPSEQQKQVQALADALPRSGTKPRTPMGAAEKLQELRKVPLGPSNGRSGYAEYSILLRNGKAVKAEPTGEKTIAGANEMLAKANFSGFFPAGAQMSLVKMGFVNCHQSVCELMLQR
jgi:tetratricopeptide (TPR) repeat protein